MIYKTNPIFRSSYSRTSRPPDRNLGAGRGLSLPHIVLGVFQVAPQNAHRLPTTRAHDGNAVVATRQQVLRCANPHKVAAEGVNRHGVQAHFARGVFDKALDETRLQRAVDRLFLIDSAEQRPDVGATPSQPLGYMYGRPAGRERNAPHAERVCLAAPDCQAQGAVTAPHDVISLQRHQFRRKHPARAAATRP